MPGNAWVLSSMGAPAIDLRRIKVHLERGGAALLSGGINYVRVLHNGHAQPATTSSGLLLNVTMIPEMGHAAGVRIQASNLAYLPRNLNASNNAQYARMHLYLLVDPQLDWLSVIPLEDVERARADIIEPTTDAVPVPIASPNVHVSAVAVQARNSSMVMGSSFVTASYYLARDNLGLKSARFLMGIGMLSATEFSDAPLFSQSTEWVANVTSEARSELTERIAMTWQWAKVILCLVAGSAWLVILNVVWSYRKQTIQIHVPVPPVVAAAVPSSTKVAAVPSQQQARPVFPIRVIKHEASSLTKSPSGSTSGAESGFGDPAEISVIPERCQADWLLIDSNPRSRMAFAPCRSEELQKCELMFSDGVSNAGNPVNGSLDEVASLCVHHIRQYRDRLRPWQCLVDKCREKGHHMDIDGVEIVECSDHLKLRLQTVHREKAFGKSVVIGEKRSTSADASVVEAANRPAESVRREVRMATPHPNKRRASSPSIVPKTTELAEPSMRKKAYCFDDPTDTTAKRFDEADDSSERDLEFLHNRGNESKTKKSKSAEVKKIRSDRMSRPRKAKEDVTSQWQKLCSFKDSSSNARDSYKGSSQNQKIDRRSTDASVLAPIAVARNPRARRSRNDVGSRNHPLV